MTLALPTDLVEQTQQATLTPQERAQGYQAWAESHAYVTAPPLAEEALRPENIYEN